MTPEKQAQTYGIVAAAVVLLLLAGQYLLQQSFASAYVELASLQGNVAAMKKTAEARHALVEKYKAFEQLTKTTDGVERGFPTNALELYAVVDRAMKENGLEHTNRSSSAGTEPGGVLQLQISFSGPYYGVMKALASIRESHYVMRVSDFKLNAQDEGRVSGSMTILSTAKKS